jgi:hypothetical protein
MVPSHEPVTASAVGIFFCLRQLAEEAANLNLPHTQFAIQQALAAIAEETDNDAEIITKH